MATLTLTAAMPALELTEGESLVLEAIDPTTGAAVTGVVCNNFTIYASESDAKTLTEEPFRTIYLSQSDGNLGRRAGDFGGPGG
jgi:hypothetical protein